MKKTDFMLKASRTFHRAGFKIKKYSPEILITAGVIGTVASAVMACKATLKVNDIIDEGKKKINDIHDVAADAKAGIIPADKYSADDKKKDLTIVYVQTGIKVAKLYAPAVILGTLSLASIIKSNDILKKRNIATAAAYATVDKAFKKYRGNVIERFGKDLDKELRYGIKAKEIEEKIIDENGNEKTVTKTVNVAENPHNLYSVVYDDGCVGWTKDPEANKCFLLQQQAHANKILQLRGHLFLNEVYDMLGVPRTSYGNVVGWIYDEEFPEGDNYVDFGIFDIYNGQKTAFVNGYERSIVLDFNVDGEILYKFA